MYDSDFLYDELSIKSIVRELLLLNIRSVPLSWERIKSWSQQFELGPERTLAWLILRNLIFRTSEQLDSSFRQALKAAIQNFSSAEEYPAEVAWRDVITKNFGELNVYCGPPIASSVIPGKSGELISRMGKQKFGMKQWYPHATTELKADERFILVDDGTFTAEQLMTFLDNWPLSRTNYSQIAIVVAIAHETAIKALKKRYPKIPIFFGEKLNKDHCFQALAKYWVDNKVWPHIDHDPIEVYKGICDKHGLLDKSNCYFGFGDLGVMVAYAHGIPDDSLNILWMNSPTWLPLIER